MKKTLSTNEVCFAFLLGLRPVLVYSFPHAEDDLEEIMLMQERRTVSSLFFWDWSSHKDSNDEFRGSQRHQTQNSFSLEAVFLP